MGRRRGFLFLFRLHSGGSGPPSATLFYLDRRARPYLSQIIDQDTQALSDINGVQGFPTLLIHDSPTKSY